MSKSKDKPLKFEEAMAQLEETLSKIEAGEVGLEESLAAYEKGMKLIAHCRSILGAAEKRIAELSVNGQGELEAGDVEVEDAPPADDQPF